MAKYVINPGEYPYAFEKKVYSDFFWERLRCPGGFFFFSFVSNICDPLNPAKEMRSSAALLWLAFGARRERWWGRG